MKFNANDNKYLTSLFTNISFGAGDSESFASYYLSKRHPKLHNLADIDSCTDIESYYRLLCFYEYLISGEDLSYESDLRKRMKAENKFKDYDDPRYGLRKHFEVAGLLESLRGELHEVKQKMPDKKTMVLYGLGTAAILYSAGAVALSIAAPQHLPVYIEAVKDFFSTLVLSATLNGFAHMVLDMVVLGLVGAMIPIALACMVTCAKKIAGVKKPEAIAVAQEEHHDLSATGGSKIRNIVENIENQDVIKNAVSTLKKSDLLRTIKFAGRDDRINMLIKKFEDSISWTNITRKDLRNLLHLMNMAAKIEPEFMRVPRDRLLDILKTDVGIFWQVASEEIRDDARIGVHYTNFAHLLFGHHHHSHLPEMAAAMTVGMAAGMAFPEQMHHVHHAMDHFMGHFFENALGNPSTVFGQAILEFLERTMLACIALDAYFVLAPSVRWIKKTYETGDEWAYFSDINERLQIMKTMFKAKVGIAMPDLGDSTGAGVSLAFGF